MTNVFSPQLKEVVLRKPMRKKEIQAWLLLNIANLLGIDANEIDIALPFDSYGLGSVTLIGLSGDIEQWLECDFNPTLLYDYPTIEALTEYLADTLSIQQ